MLPELGGVCVTANIERAEVFTPLHRLGKRVLAVAILTGILAFAFAIPVARYFARPVSRLSQSARRIQAGDLECEIDEPAGPAELSELTRNFNAMISSLREAQELRHPPPRRSRPRFEEPALGDRGLVAR